MSKLHVVLSCTNRKRAQSGPWLRLRDLRPKSGDRAASWIDRVSTATFNVQADNLYGGEYWCAGAELRARGGQLFNAEGWVLSAGFGLISVSEMICAYSATLTVGDPDSVVGRSPRGESTSQQRRRWWAALAAWPGPGEGAGPRTLANLASRDQGSSIVVVAGPGYLDAASDDLAEAQRNLYAPEQLLVFGSGAPRPELEAAWITVPGQLRTRLGGSMSSTGVRAALAVLEDPSSTERVSVGRARQVVGGLVGSSDPLPVYDRKRLDDEEITDWLHAHLGEHQGATKSVTLRDFRAVGMACEQTRFGRLFDVAMDRPT